MASAHAVFVTGASGFIGGTLCRRLLDLGHEIHAPLRPETRRWRIEPLMAHERFIPHAADLRDAKTLATALNASGAKTVVHLATYGGYEAQSDPHAILETNVVGTLNLLEAGAAAGITLFVNAGSSSEYDYKSGPMKETDRLDPNSHYAVAKAAQTHLCHLQSLERDLPLVNFRLFSVYGPWEEPTRLIPTLLRRARGGPDPPDGEPADRPGLWLCERHRRCPVGLRSPPWAPRRSDQSG